MKMRVLFWNVQRLGLGSSEDKKIAIESVIAQYLNNRSVDMVLFCEITSSFEFGNFALNKSNARPRRGKRLRSSQLGYAGLTHSNKTLVFKREEVVNYNGLGRGGYAYKGGNTFVKQSKRDLVKSTCNNVPVFLYHANASYKAKESIIWITHHLKRNYEKFLLVGDFNCQPSSLRCLEQEDERIQVVDGGNSHFNRGTLDKTLDYAIGYNISSLTCQVADFSTELTAMGLKQSDHLPIIVNFH